MGERHLMYSGSITDVQGLLVGHAQDTIGMTGVSVVLAPNGAVCGVDVRGSAPGTRETDPVSYTHLDVYKRQPEDGARIPACSRL